MNKELGIRILKVVSLIVLLYSLFFILYSTPALAQTEYKLLAPIPLDNLNMVSETTNTSQYISGLFRLGVAIATGLAVIMLIYAGIKYMSTDAFGEKSEAKGIIENALWGLLFAMSAWLIVATIFSNTGGTITFNLDTTLPPPTTLEISTSTPPIASPCNDCTVIGVNHKPAPLGCAAPGPCRINRVVNGKLIELDRITDFYVTESYPPTVRHRNSCHYNGTCVDATIASASEARVKDFIEKAIGVGLNAQFETATEKRAQDIRRATGLSSSQVYYVSGINNEHFSIYNR